ncbi:MAG: type II toxin-antitoxin system RelE/ParE family toxin [Gemmatimonadota bacterium]
MAHEIRFAPSAARTFRALPVALRRRLAAKIDGLAEDPRPHGAKKLTGMKDVYRLRVGEYRVIYAIRSKELVVLVLKIGHRGEVYRS